MKRITLTTIAVALATAFFASAALAAPAANRSDPRLDTIASAVAGHPVNVWCEDNATDWGAGPAPTVWGYTYPPPSSNTIHVSPWICMNLHTVLDTTNRDELAMYAVAAAIHTLVHESVHQRGGIYGDCYANGPTDMGCEGRTDCMALTLDVAVAVDYFGFVRTITTRTAATYKWAWQTVHHKRKRVRIIRTIAFTQAISSPELDAFRWYTQAIHNGLPVQYQGDCST
jgi:hypothetical protein